MLNARWTIAALCLGGGLFSPPSAGQDCQARLVAGDSTSGDRNGISVSFSANTVLLGASGDDGSAGSAYVFTRQSDGAWHEQARLTDPNRNTNDQFGCAVSISGDAALIGSRFADVGIANSGSAFIFRAQSDGTWALEATLAVSDTELNHYLGNSVSLFGDTALVGAFGDDGDGTNSGSVYVFQRQADGSWAESAKLTASNAAANSAFGYSVSLSGDRALVGASFANADGLAECGAAYIFRRQADGTWLEVASLLASDATGYDFFGLAVSIDGPLALVGAPDAGGEGGMLGAGSAYLYKEDSEGTWNEVEVIVPLDPTDGDDFAHRVDLLGDIALLGSWGDDDSGSSSGSAYLFRRQPDDTWVQSVKLLASDGAPGDHFGSAVSLAGSQALVGSLGESGYAGAAYVFPAADDDCNANGVNDGCELGDDVDGSGTLDECDCLADVNGDAFVTVEDLLVVIEQWGNQGGPGDVTWDGTVDIDDLLSVVNAWGACPA